MSETDERVYVDYECKDHIATIAMNRPEKLNAVSDEVVRQLMTAFRRFDADPDADDDVAYKSPAYFLEDAASDIAESLEAAEWEETKNNSLYVAMSELDERSRDIITSRWLADDKATLHELAAKYSVSAERIRQLEKNAMDKVKAMILA